MSKHAAAPTRQAAAPEHSSKGELMLQRKCACGQHTLAGGECAECRKRRLIIQRWASNRTAPEATLRSQAQSSHRAPGTFDGTRFGRDFSRVRVHTNNAVVERHRPAPADIQHSSPSLRSQLQLQSAGKHGPVRVVQQAARLAPGNSGREISPPHAAITPPFLSDEDDELSMDSDRRRRTEARRPTTVPQSPALTATGLSLTETNPLRDTRTPGYLPAVDDEPSVGSIGRANEPPQLLPADGASADTGASGGGASPGFLQEDAAVDLMPGQMRRSEFLAELRMTVCRTAESALADTGRTTDDCPYLAFWFDYYGGQSSEHIERAIHRYAPETVRAASAREYIPLIAARVRQGVEAWTSTGEITGVPEDLPAGVSASTLGPHGDGETTPAGTLFFKTRDGGARTADDPEAIQAQLDDGRPLDSGVRSRMESAFGSAFGHVRVHNNTTAARLSSTLHARAFTVGEHVAFAAGEYRPGTLLGDALIAHELAHVVQQGGRDPSPAPMRLGDPGYGALEADADRAAAGVMASLWNNPQEGLAAIAGRTLPLLRSGLSLQRCGDCFTGGKSSSSNTIVCDGSGGIKVKVTESGLGGAAGVSCGLVDCATRHEESHRSDTLAICPDICKGKEADIQVTLSSSERAKQEVKASNVEIGCLKGHLEKHKKSGDAACQTMVEDRIKQMEEYRDGFK